jgi:pimeloyl-ACP methyl ester carboxylesterase
MPHSRLSTGVELFFEESGSGDPLILIYGAGGDHHTWRPQIEPLGSKYRLLLPDLRGAGLSEDDGGEWTIKTFADDIIALLDQLDIAQAHVCGMSLGSAVAQELAIGWPERVGTAILMNTWARTDARLELLWNHVLFLQGLAAEAAREDPPRAEPHQQDLVNLNLALFFSPLALAENRVSVDEWWQVYVGGMQEEGVGRHFRAAMGHDALERLPGVTVPTLVLVGEEDYFTPYYGKQVAAAIPGAELRVLEGSGSSHGMHWERPDDINGEIVAFVDRHKLAVRG